MKSTFLLVCALWAIPTLHAQTVSGTVTDGETGDVLPGVSVFLPTQDIGATTNIAGRYELILPSEGTFRTVFSYIGYKTETRSITVRGGTALDVVLTPSFVEIGDVTITAQATASDVLSTPQSTAIVDEDLLARTAGASPLDALDQIAGVRLLRTGPAVAKPVIRGLTSQRVLVIADGVRQEGQGWGDEHGPEIGSGAVDRIEVVRGPSSLLYGSDALGGVVQTIQRDLFATESSLEGNLRLTGLTATQQGSGDLTLGGRSGNWAYEGRLGLLRAGHVNTPNDLILNTAQEQTTGSVRLGREFQNGGHVVLHGSGFTSTLGLFEPDLLGEEGEELNLGRYDIAEPFQEIQHLRGQAEIELPLGSNRLEVRTALQQNRRNEFGHHHGEEEEEHEGEEHEEEHHEEEEPALTLHLTTATADVRLHHRPVGRVFGTVGVSGMWQQNETLAEETLIPGARTLNGAVYVTEELVLPTLTFDAGLRFDVRSLENDASEELNLMAGSRSYTALTGAIGAAWQPRGDLSIAANLGRAFRAPQLIELFGNGVHEGTLRFERGSADLSPETSLSLDGVIRYLTPHMYAEVSGFVNQISQYIFPRATSEIDPQSGLLIYQYGQADARLVGGEFRVDIHPHSFHGLGLHVAGDITRGTNQETSEPLPFVPPARLQTALEYKVEDTGPAEDLEFRLGPTFVASQNRAELPEEVPTDSYVSWESSVSATFYGNGFSVSPVLSVENLFNADYVDPMSRFRPYGVSAMGRNVRFSVRVGFGG